MGGWGSCSGASVNLVGIWPYRYIRVGSCGSAGRCTKGTRDCHTILLSAGQRYTRQRGKITKTPFFNILEIMQPQGMQFHSWDKAIRMYSVLLSCLEKLVWLWPSLPNTFFLLSQIFECFFPWCNFSSKMCAKSRIWAPFAYSTTVLCFFSC